MNTEQTGNNGNQTAVIRKVLVDRWGWTATHHYFIADTPHSPYYRVWRDPESETVEYVNPRDPRQNNTVHRQFCQPHVERRQVSTIIRNDLIRRGIAPPRVIPEPDDA
jgi:hypothetical protein